jgi:polyhydroxyalkanoate synthase subunit PhaC
VSDQKALPEDADQWLGDATSLKGSWWNDWAKWLEPHLGNRVASPKSTGSKAFAPIEAAPGRYVKERSV